MIGVWYDSGTFYVSAALVIVTVALVVVTNKMSDSSGETANATRALVAATTALVEETERARALSVTPALVIDVMWWGDYAFVELHSVGEGAAHKVDVTLEFVPRAGHQGNLLGDATRLWRASVLPPGARHRFNPPVGAGGRLMMADELAAHVDSITLRGTVVDLMGKEHMVDAEIASFGDRVEGEKTSQRQVIPAAPDERQSYYVEQIAGFAERAERHSFTIATQTEQIALALGEIAELVRDQPVTNEPSKASE